MVLRRGPLVVVLRLLLGGGGGRTIPHSDAAVAATDSLLVQAVCP